MSEKNHSRSREKYRKQNTDYHNYKPRPQHPKKQQENIISFSQKHQPPSTKSHQKSAKRALLYSLNEFQITDHAGMLTNQLKSLKSQQKSNLITNDSKEGKVLLDQFNIAKMHTRAKHSLSTHSKTNKLGNFSVKEPTTKKTSEPSNTGSDSQHSYYRLHNPRFRVESTDKKSSNSSRFKQIKYVIEDDIKDYDERRSGRASPMNTERVVKRFAGGRQPSSRQYKVEHSDFQVIEEEGRGVPGGGNGVELTEIRLTPTAKTSKRGPGTAESARKGRKGNSRGVEILDFFQVETESDVMGDFVRVSDRSLTRNLPKNVKIGSDLKHSPSSRGNDPSNFSSFGTKKKDKLSALEANNNELMASNMRLKKHLAEILIEKTGSKNHSSGPLEHDFVHREPRFSPRRHTKVRKYHEDLKTTQKLKKAKNAEKVDFERKKQISEIEASIRKNKTILEKELQEENQRLLDTIKKMRKLKKGGQWRAESRDGSANQAPGRHRRSYTNFKTTLVKNGGQRSRSRPEKDFQNFNAILFLDLLRAAYSRLRELFNDHEQFTQEREFGLMLKMLKNIKNIILKEGGQIKRNTESELRDLHLKTLKCMSFFDPKSLKKHFWKFFEKKSPSAPRASISPGRGYSRRQSCYNDQKSQQRSPNGRRGCSKCSRRTSLNRRYESDLAKWNQSVNTASVNGAGNGQTERAGSKNPKEFQLSYKALSTSYKDLKSDYELLTKGNKTLKESNGKLRLEIEKLCKILENQNLVIPAHTKQIIYVPEPTPGTGVVIDQLPAAYAPQNYQIPPNLRNGQKYHFNGYSAHQTATNQLSPPYGYREKLLLQRSPSRSPVVKKVLGGLSPSLDKNHSLRRHAGRFDTVDLRSRGMPASISPDRKQLFLDSSLNYQSPSPSSLRRRKHSVSSSARRRLLSSKERVTFGPERLVEQKVSFGPARLVEERVEERIGSTPRSILRNG